LRVPSPLCGKVGGYIKSIRNGNEKKRGEILEKERSGGLLNMLLNRVNKEEENQENRQFVTVFELFF
jgi:hypothetical protein